MKILIVDDNQEVRLLLRDYLPPSFEEIYECADGSEAISFFKKHRPDWVLMDWQMPSAGGIIATREIIAEFPGANICMVTAFDNEDIRSEAFAAGVIGFILKDDLDELEEFLVNEAGH